jgi:hypothetical protein
MPVIAVNLSARVFARVSGLVERGLYASAEQFLDVAACNQLALESGVTPEELIGKDHRKPFPVEDAPPARASKESRSSTAGRTHAKKRPGKRRGASTQRQASSQPATDLGEVLDRLSIQRCRPAQLSAIEISPRGEEDHIWGQVNRLLPFKIACRWLAVFASEAGGWPDLQAIGSRLADDAARLGTMLAESDTKAQRVRDGQLATSLPRIGNMASQDRFLSQFVARATRSGRLYPGAICHYALASIDGNRLLLTKPGLEFALLTNPVLDSPLDQVDCALSPEEREFLQCQVIRYVPSECHDSALVAGAILEGNDTPGTLAEAVFGQFPADWTTAAKQTHLSGIVARLTEMGVVSRTWSGRKVAYGIAKVDRCPLYDQIAKITG